MNNMAKLNVVIPAVEVTVDDVAYRKVDRKAQAGDIIRFDDAHLPSYVRDGAFYAVEGVSDGGYPYITDEDGDRYGTAGDDFEVYAPISEPTTETIAFEGATWRKVDRDVREGDAIKFTNDSRRSYLADAELYVVNYVDSCDDPQITDDDGDDYDAGGVDYEVYEKVTEEKAETVTERKARAGDRVRIVDRLRVSDPYNNGDVLTVIKRLDPDRVTLSVNGESAIARDEEFVVLEPVTAEPDSLAVGEYARFVLDGVSVMRTGDIVEILAVDTSTVPYHTKRLTDGKVAWTQAKKIVRATDEEVAKAAAAKDPRSQFAAGDKVRLVSGGTKWPLSGFEDGGIYTVDSPINSYHKGTRVEIKTGGLSGFALPSDIVKLTAAEIAEIERKQAEEDAKRAEEARWSAIGRKVNEIKAGDVVQTYKAECGHPVGTVGIASRSGDASSISVEVAGKMTFYHFVKLIVPAEQRFDRSADDVVEEVAAA